jgi:hypothetical protein
VDLLNQAIARDGAFVLAYCWLALAHDSLYFQEVDRTSERLALANAAINSAFRLKPDLGEAHLALASHLYYGYFDYDRARAELAITQRTLPSNPQVFQLAGVIEPAAGPLVGDRAQSRARKQARSPKRFYHGYCCDYLSASARL